MGGNAYKLKVVSFYKLYLLTNNPNLKIDMKASIGESDSHLTGSYYLYVTINYTIDSSLNLLSVETNLLYNPYSRKRFMSLHFTIQISEKIRLRNRVMYLWFSVRFSRLFFF